MKKYLPLFSLGISYLLISLFLAPSLFAQTQQELSTQTVSDLEGNDVSTEEIIKPGTPVILSFWATWCAPCILELKNISQKYADWQKETGVVLVAVSIDHPRKLEAVKKMVAENAWTYQVFMDKGGAFRKSMNVVSIPHTFLLDAKGKIVYQSTSYAAGDEENLYEKVQEIAQP